MGDIHRSEGALQMVRQIQRFLATQKDLLQAETWRDLVKKQSEAISHRLENTPLTWEVIANIAELLKEGPWTEGQHTMLSVAMSEGAGRGEKTTRRPNQTCKDFSPYWSLGDIDILKGTCPLAQKLDTIASRMVAW